MQVKQLAPVALMMFMVPGLAGCLEDGSGTPVVVPDELGLDGLLNLTALAVPVNFTESIVTAAVSFTNDLYEPTMEVSDSGTIFITGHTILVDTTGAPVFRSTDGGVSWEQLPWFQDQRMPGDVHGATPPPSDEIFLVAGENGDLWGVDITLGTFPVNGWADDGARHIYHNPNAYDEHQVVAQADECVAAPIKDRPWVAYADGTILLVNNDGAGPAQIGILDVPPITPVGVGATAQLGRWNVCAGPNYAPASNSIEGIPDMRDDGLFAVPQRANGQLFVTLGNKASIYHLDIKPIFPVSTGGEITSVYGQAAFDDDGVLYVGITNNTAPDINDIREGRMRFGVSDDGGTSFDVVTFSTGPGPIRHMYMDGNRFGPGSLVVWAVDGDSTNQDGDTTAWDWYAGHLYLGDEGPVMHKVMQIIDEGARPSPHVTGAALGPDGRAYTAMYDTSRGDGTPLSVFIQETGPTMPIA